MEIIQNSNGGLKLCIEGCTSMYTKKYAGTNRIRWECSQRVAHSCSRDVSTDLEVMFTAILTLSLVVSYKVGYKLAVL